MRVRIWILFAMEVMASGCGSHGNVGGGSELTSAQKQVVEDGVRRLMLGVAHDVSTDGPVAWHKYFADSPAFFMAVDGQLAFANSEAAAAGTDNFAKTIQHIELHWGDQVRVDALTAEFAVVATPWVEVQTDLKGHAATTSGFFTAVAENRDGQWRFRDAHWSEPVVAAKAP
ncbi:MAG TPA: hypothetical protein VGF20_03085 [Candidatus Acidoferrum sp.]|jgi:hypothetical protein